MATDHKINGTTYSYIETADWRENAIRDGRALDQQTTTNAFRTLVWTTNIMPISEFDTLYALEGQKVTVTTVDYTDRDSGSFATYYGAILEGIQANHESVNITSLNVTFRVRVQG